MNPAEMMVYMAAFAGGLVPIIFVVAIAVGLIRRQWDRAGDASWERRMLNREQSR